MKSLYLLFITLFIGTLCNSQQRVRELGLKFGVLEPGQYNAITDVKGVRVGHTTLLKGDQVRTGVTAIIPAPGNIFQYKLPAAIYVGNGFGKLAGITQVKELGNLETPIILTNTLSVPVAMDAVIGYTLEQKGNERVQSVNAVVGETNDGVINDIRGRHITREDVLNAINSAKDGPVAEGSVGAGTGTVAFGFKGGIGTSSRRLPAIMNGYTVGVLVQTNYGGMLEIAGVPVMQELANMKPLDELQKKADGSCMIVVATDAPLDSRNLERLAKRAFMALAKTGSYASNGSGDYVIAFSTDSSLRIPHSPVIKTLQPTLLQNDAVNGLFQAAVEATEEALLNSLFMATPVSGKNKNIVPVLPVKRVMEIMRRYHRL